VTTINWIRNRGDVANVVRLLRICDGDFTPRLSERVDIEDYAGQIVQLAQRIEAWDNDVLVGLVAIYCNAPAGDEAFITNVSVAPDHRGRGIARCLVEDAIRCALEIGFTRVALEVDASATEALKLYARTGFKITGGDGQTLRLTTDLSGTA
jgi:ribosomal protein S18 acetylase RimI-like enzyme